MFEETPKLVTPRFQERHQQQQQHHHHQQQQQQHQHQRQLLLRIVHFFLYPGRVRNLKRFSYLLRASY